MLFTSEPLLTFVEYNSITCRWGFVLFAPVAPQGVCVCVLVPSLHALSTVSSAAGFFETEHETFQHAARRALGLVVVAMENILSAWKKPPCTK